MSVHLLHNILNHVACLQIQEDTDTVISSRPPQADVVDHLRELLIILFILYSFIHLFLELMNNGRRLGLAERTHVTKTTEILSSCFQRGNLSK